MYRYVYIYILFIYVYMHVFTHAHMGMTSDFCVYERSCQVLIDCSNGASDYGNKLLGRRYGGGSGVVVAAAFWSAGVLGGRPTGSWQAR